MRSLFFALLAVCFALGPAGAKIARPSKPATVTIDGGRLGRVALTLPKSQSNDVIIFFADDPASPTITARIKSLTGLGAAVAVVDSRTYLAALSADKGECLWLSSEVEDLNRAIQRKLAFPDFRLPVLASVGQGGVLVYTLLAEAPSYSFAGGVSIDFTPAAGARLDFCGVGKVKGRKGWLPTVNVNLPWRVVPMPGEGDEIAEWLSDVDKAELAPASDDLASLVVPVLNSAITKDPNSLEDLPLIEISTGKPAPYIAVIWSGDGGWRDLDRTLGQLLAANGVPVVGVDSLLYFWQPKRPEVVAHDIDRIVEHYRQAWKINKFVLIGYSFGADILPFAYNRMVPEDKARIAQLSLLALSQNTRFEITVSEFLSGEATSQSRPVGPELARINPALVQCFYGEDEADDSVCPTKDAARVELIKTEGGHHFGDDYEALAKRIMAGAAKRIR